MKWTSIISSMALGAGLMFTASCSHLASGDPSLPAWHPEPLSQGRVSCSECHVDQVRGILKPYESFDHTESFIKSHRLYAPRDERLCAACHQSSFCNDCHSRKLEMKPSLRYGERPDREFMHRGDYLTRHKIDGKADPTSCYRCHGRTNNEQCRSCHR